MQYVLIFVLLLSFVFGLGLIARRLDISVKTAQAHRENLKQKLNLRSTAAMVQYATCADTEFRKPPWLLPQTPIVLSYMRTM